jgi:general secretion pathway protein I
MNYSDKQHERGLTLIEVLIALAIVAIAMTAAIKAVSTSISGIAHLQEKTMAMWVGEQAINEARAGVIKMPSHEVLRQETKLLNRNWHWVLSQKLTPNPRIRKISVKVFANSEDEDQDNYIVELTSFLYQPSQGNQAK